MDSDYCDSIQHAVRTLMIWKIFHIEALQHGLSKPVTAKHYCRNPLKGFAALSIRHVLLH